MTQLPKIHPLRVILFGATGMIGSSALQACLKDKEVTAVLAVGRSSCGVSHPKLTEVLHADLFNLEPIAAQLSGYNACLFALGISSVGMNEAGYKHITHDLTLSVARHLLKLNPDLGFCYVSAAGTDSHSKQMWARVRGTAENELLSLPFREVACVRPGGIQPGPGVRSKVKLYQAFIVLMRPVFPLLVRYLPDYVTTSKRLATAMIRAMRGQADKKILESIDINLLGLEL